MSGWLTGHTVTAYGAVVLPIGTLAFSSVTSQKDDHVYNRCYGGGDGYVIHQYDAYLDS